MAESFFSGFKREVIDGEHFATRAQARVAIFTWLNWYNRTRLHSSIGNCPAARVRTAPCTAITRSVNRVRYVGERQAMHNHTGHPPAGPLAVGIANGVRTTCLLCSPPLRAQR